MEQWKYVRSELNPADYTSRGTEDKQFLDTKTWLNGPVFLWGTENNVPTDSVSTVLNENEVRNNIATNMTVLKEENHILSCLKRNISSWYHMKRTLLLVFGIIKHKKFVNITPNFEDLKESEHKIIKWMQQKEFSTISNILRQIQQSNADRE